MGPVRNRDGFGANRSGFVRNRDLRVAGSGERAQMGKTPNAEKKKGQAAECR
jgi:hypothetical protein